MKPAKEQRLPIALVLALILGGLSYLHSSASFRSSSLGGGMRGISTLADSSQRGAKGQSSRIYIEHADLLSYDASLQPGVQRLKGGVIFRHGNARMTCDSAYINEQAQTFEAFGEVHMVQGDTVNMYARYLYYDGITRLAKLRSTCTWRIRPPTSTPTASTTTAWPTSPTTSRADPSPTLRTR